MERASLNQSLRKFKFSAGETVRPEPRASGCSARWSASDVHRPGFRQSVRTLAALIVSSGTLLETLMDDKTQTGTPDRQSMVEDLQEDEIVALARKFGRSTYMVRDVVRNYGPKREDIEARL
jgi:hypothetical protein